MASTTLNLNVMEKRILSAVEAANYCGIPRSQFPKVCPVQPVQLARKFKGYDKRDLDQWIEAEKTQGEAMGHDDILGRLE